MKKTFLITLAAGAISWAGCNSSEQGQDKERQDSIEAAAAADSMLRDVIQEADTAISTDSIIVDTVPAGNNR
ncbi:MAG TPA: hypothetical protein VGE26_08015 [Sphingobacteriaceae bacterium]